MILCVTFRDLGLLGACWYVRLCLVVCERVFMCVWQRVSRGDVRSGLAEWFSNADQLTTVLFLSSDTPSELVWGPYDALWTCVCVPCFLWRERCFILTRGSGICLRCCCVWVLRVCLVCVGVESLSSVCGLLLVWSPNSVCVYNQNCHFFFSLSF